MHARYSFPDAMVTATNLTGTMGPTPPVVVVEGKPPQTSVLLLVYSSFSDIASHANRLEFSSICACSKMKVDHFLFVSVRNTKREGLKWLQAHCKGFGKWRLTNSPHGLSNHVKCNRLSRMGLQELSQHTSQMMASVAEALAAWTTGLEARFAKLPTPVDGSC